MIKYFKRRLLNKANRKNDELFQFIQDGYLSVNGWYGGEAGGYSIYRDSLDFKELKEEFEAHQEFGFYVWYLVEQEIERLINEDIKKQKDSKSNICERLEFLEKELKELKKRVDK